MDRLPLWSFFWALTFHLTSRGRTSQPLFKLYRCFIHSNNYYSSLSDCLWLYSKDFWGRRWNLVASSLLRDAIFVPCKTYLASIFPQKGASAISIMLTFFASGVMHEFIIYNAIGHLNGLSLEWLMFFMISGASLVLELFLKDLWDQFGFKRPPQLLATTLTLSCILVLANVLFFPPIQRNGLDHLAIKEYRNLLPDLPFIVPLAFPSHSELKWKVNESSNEPHFLHNAPCFD